MKLITKLTLLVLAISFSSIPVFAEGLEKRSEKLSIEFGRQLKAKLSATINEAGLEGGIEVCKDEAPKIASKLSLESGAKVQRVSKKYRNPLNMPSDWQYEILSFFENEKFNADTYYQDDGVDTVKYMKAIKTEGICLACHGQNIAGNVKQSLNKNYPNDLATGYDLREVRGAFSIEWPSKHEQALRIKKFRKFSNELYLGGQPKEEQFAFLKQLGIKTVINLRPKKELKFDEEKVAKIEGFSYINLPIKGEKDITFKNRDKLQQILTNAEKPVFLHCSSSNRVGALLALIAAKKGSSLEEALLYGRISGMTRLSKPVKKIISKDIKTKVSQHQNEAQK